MQKIFGGGGEITIKNSDIFENMTFFWVKKSEIVDFVDLPSTFLVCNVSIRPIC